MLDKSNIFNKEINVTLIEEIFNLISPEAKESINILSIPNLLFNSLAESLLTEYGTPNSSPQKIIEEILSFPIWHYRTKISWVIDDDIRKYVLEKMPNDKRTEMMENVLRVLKENYTRFENFPLVNLDDYKIQIFYLSSKLIKHVSEGIYGFRNLFNSAVTHNQMEIVRAIDLSLEEIFGEYLSSNELKPDELVSIYFMRGYYAYKTKKYDKAIKFLLPIFEKSCNLIECIGDLARVSYLMGIIWTDLQQYEKAENAFKRTLELFEKMTDSTYKAQFHQIYVDLLNLSSCCYWDAEDNSKLAHTLAKIRQTYLDTVIKQNNIRINPHIYHIVDTFKSLDDYENLKNCLPSPILIAGDKYRFMSDMEEALQGIELLSQLNSAMRKDAANYQQIELTIHGLNNQTMEDPKNFSGRVNIINTKFDENWLNHNNLPIIKYSDEFKMEEIKHIIERERVNVINRKLDEMNTLLEVINGKHVMFKISKENAIEDSVAQIVAKISLGDFQCPGLLEDLTGVKGINVGLSKLPERLIQIIRCYLSILK